MGISLSRLAQGKRKYLLVVLFILALLLTISLSFCTRRENPVYLALVAPLTGEQQANGEQMVKGASMYLDEVNQSGGINGHPVKLVVFDDQNNPEIAQQTAQKIAQQRKFLTVLGHFYSSTSIVAGEVYQQAGIAAISGSATARAVTEDNEWYFRTVFSNKSQANFLANYVLKILQQQRASIIYDQDDYGSSLATTFANTFKGLGGEIQYQWSFDKTEDSLGTTQRKIISDLTAENIDNPGIIFFAAHDVEAAQIITQMKRSGLNYPLIGADSLGTVIFSDRFNQYPEEQANPGYFSNGIYATSPLIFDVASEQAQDFKTSFIEKYESEPTWAAATYYDAALVAVEGIKKAQLDFNSSNVKKQRKLVRDALAQINSVENAIEGIEGFIYFDTQGNVVSQVPIGIFTNQYFIPALTQLQPVVDLRQIADLDEELAIGNILIVDSRYLHKVNIVYTGIDLRRISNLDLKSSSYTADFYLWFRYQGNLDPDRFELINLAESLQIKELIAESKADNFNYHAYRLKGVFKGDFDFRDYPFDSQDLSIKFRHADWERDSLIYVSDVVGMRDITNQGILAKFTKNKIFEDLSNWQIRRVRFFQDIIKDNSTLGNPQFLELKFDDKIEHSRFNVVISLQRNSKSFIIKNLLPIFLVIIAAYLLLFLSAEAIAPRTVAGLNALLTTAFFHVRLSNDLPTVGYVVAIEYIFYLMYLLCLFGLFITVFSYVELKRNNSIQVKRLDQIGKTVYPTLFLISGLLFTYHYILTPLLAHQAEVTNGNRPNNIPQVIETNISQEATDLVTLTLGSWRTDDQTQIDQIFSVFQQKYSQIKINFSPTNPLDYQSVLDNQLKNNEAPDLFYIHPYSDSQKMIVGGYLNPLPNSENLADKFAPESLEPWQGKDGRTYALPVMAVSHGIYYNQDIFNSLGLQIPTTWQELLSTATVLKNADYIPFANGSKIDLVLVENVFMNLAPNFIEGRTGRLKYLSGERCFNDKNSVAAFQALAELKPFLPINHENLTEAGSKQLFLTGKAAMWMGGSWRISALEAANPNFSWSVMAVPPPRGKYAQINFHPDFAIGINPKSPHQQEAQQFLQWLSTPQAAELFANELPGFFPLHKKVPTIKNQHAQDFLKLNQGRGTDVRWAAVELGNGLPDGYSLMQKASAEVVRGNMTPQQGADYLQGGLAQWFESAQKCEN